jgi:hypothetical protein
MFFLEKVRDNIGAFRVEEIKEIKIVNFQKK